MKLALSSQITKIDEFCAETLGIPTLDLMKKSGDAVAGTVREMLPCGSSVSILAGKGNNGGDGYAAACNLYKDYKVTVFDIFSQGQRTKEGKYFYDAFLSLGGEVRSYDASFDTLKQIKESAMIVDAIFGTGFQGEVPEDLRSLAIAIREAVSARKLAVDVPLGINADNGSVSDFAISVDKTVELSLIKPGIVSYPARSYVGDVVYDSLGIPLDKIYENFSFKYHLIKEDEILRCLPRRESNSNKGSFGKLLVITGSRKYKGAAHLTLEAALRGGVGLVSFMGMGEQIFELSAKYPEIVYREISDISFLEDSEIDEIVGISSSYNAVLIGSGSDNTDGLYKLTLALLKSSRSALVLDADAINALAEHKEEGIAAIKSASCPVILTPHPLEFARLAGLDVAYVQQHRIEVAEEFAKTFGVTLVLKGAGTIIADGESVIVNSCGSSALAKAGSGDVLAGFLAALSAQKNINPTLAATLGVAFHAMAGDSLAKEFSSYGVTPSDLPKEIARLVAKAENQTESRPV